MSFEMTRRQFLKGALAGAFVTGLGSMLPMPAWSASPKDRGDLRAGGPSSRYDLEIGYEPMVLDGREEPVRATAINGSVPGPLVHLREGDRVRLNVTNAMPDTRHTSIHWHGILVPYAMDGVPGVNFTGISPGETYRYRYEVVQAGTYWYHSHSFFQEQTGTYGPLIIEPEDGEPFHYDRDYVVLLSDWTSDGPHRAFRNLKLGEEYYNFQKRTVWDFLDDVRGRGLGSTLSERAAWGRMRMSPVDLAAITGSEYTFLMNGQSPEMNWTGLFEPGETIRLRFINASAMSTFDVRIPGLDMQVVMVDGKAVQPVDVHEFRISVAETVDVLVRPTGHRAHTVFAESLDRSGYARGTLSPEPGASAPVPSLRPRPVRTMAEMGMGMMHGMDDNGTMHVGSEKQHAGHGGGPTISASPGPDPLKPDDTVSVAMLNRNPRYRLDEPGVGLGKDGWDVLSYADLASAEEQPYPSRVDREMTIHITANMERFMFSFDGKKFSQHPGPYRFRYRERLRLWLVNHTMMGHPIHLHGMWMQIENGRSHDRLPYKHTVFVKPGEKLPVLITPIEKGDWAFHCHFLYHMDAGMFQVVRVT